MTATDTPVNNGVNVEALLGARDALTSAPEAVHLGEHGCHLRLDGRRGAQDLEDRP